MREPDVVRPPWSALAAAVAAVAATYVYFLLFAEFALLNLFQNGANPAPPRQVMWVLGAGGVAGSMWAGWTYRPERFARRLGLAFLAAGASGVLLLVATDVAVQRTAVLGVGATLGGLTVTLASGLRGVVGTRQLGRVIGAGTGLAYALCNVPALFTASARVQTTVAVVAVLLAAMAPRFFPTGRVAKGERGPAGAGSLGRWIGMFLVLVWFDSAAFYIIQHTDTLRDATWAGAGRLWSNAGLHFGAALVAGWALDRGAVRGVVGFGLAALVGACLSLEATGHAARGASVLYTLGVSAYSVALVQVPAMRGRGLDSAWLFAIAGWIGSALGIGMAQDLARVPLAFVSGAAVVGAALLLRRPRRRGLGTVGALLLLVGGGAPAVEAGAPDARVLRGREVYIAEGCIHCHSQYHRPGTADVKRWGQERALGPTLAASPPLIGNRRQGPDLARVGQRRTPEWNRLHLIAPRSITPRSRMPSYAHLFRPGERAGDDLVAYLSSLGGEAAAERPAPTGATPRRRLAATEPIAQAARQR